MQAGCRLWVAVAAIVCLSAQASWSQTSDTAPAAGVILGSAGAEPRVSLVYHFQPGQFSHYEVVNKMTMTTQFQQLTQVVKNESTAWKQFRVVTVDEQGNALLEPIVQRVVMSAQFDAEPPVQCDSEKPNEAPAQFQQVLQTVKKPVAQVKVSPQGTLLQVTVMDGASAQMQAGGNRVDPQLNFLTAVPKEPVGVGANWKERYDIPVRIDQQLSQRVTLQRTYEVTDISGDLVTLSLKTVVITPVSDPQIAMQLMQRTPGGTLKFDLQKGRIVSQELAVAKTVVGALGPQSQVSSSLETVERLVVKDTAAAASFVKP